MPKLVQVMKNEPRIEFPLEDGANTIGRGIGNEIVIPSIKVSRQHARIVLKEEGYVIVDLQSTNGTFVNGTKINERPLEEGDEILVGNIRFFFKLEEEDKIEISQKEIQDMVNTVRTIMSESAEESKQLLKALERIDTRVRSVAVRMRGAYQNSSALIFLKNDLMDLSEQMKKLFKDAEDIGRALQAQSVLIRIGHIIHSIFDVRQILDVCVDLLMESVGGTRGLLFLQGEDETLKTEVVHERKAGGKLQSAHRVQEELAREVASTGQARIYSRADLGLSVHSLVETDEAAVICLPLQGYQKVLGVVYLDLLPRGNPLGDSDLPVLGAIANQTATAVENAFLYKESLEREKINRDLELAREIQYGLLPDEPPEIPGFQINASLSFAKIVGGDYYDFIPLENGKWGLLIADVSGKGIPAALIAASSKVQARALTQTTKEPAEFLEKLNNILAAELASDHYITMVFGIIDPHTKTFNYSRAGHEPPFFVRGNGGEAQTLMKGGFPVGLFSKASYEQETIELQPGDRILFFTDGISDAMSTDGDSFGKQRVVDFLSEHRSLSCEQIGTQLLQAVKHFSQGGTRFDDRTLIVFGRD
ncbi:MAG: SpoIIE family protein phosphatase [bacterium]|nr:SpoIIE family protein phosphatase [bacterium]